MDLWVGLGWFLLSGQESCGNAVPGSVVQSVAFIKGKFFSGTGFIVRPDVIVMNKHFIAKKITDLLEVYFPSSADDAKGPFSVELFYKDPERDLAFMSIGTKLPELKLAHQRSFRRGQDIIVIGNPGVGRD